MSFHRKTLGFAVMLASAIASFAAPASTDLTYSFSGLDLDDGTNNGLEVTLDGTVTVPEGNSFEWNPPIAIDVTVYYNGELIKTFTDPNYLLYYAVEVGNILDISSDINHPDSDGDYVGLTFYSNTGLVYGTFGSLAFDHAFDTKVPVPYTVNGVPVTISIPEASTWAMMAVGFAGLGFMGWRSRKTASHAA